MTSLEIHQIIHDISQHDRRTLSQPARTLPWSLQHLPAKLQRPPQIHPATGRRHHRCETKLHVFKPQAICQTQAGQIPGRSMQEGKTPILAKTTALKTQQHAEDQIVEGCVSRLVGMPPQKQSVQSLFVVG